MKITKLRRIVILQKQNLKFGLHRELIFIYLFLLYNICVCFFVKKLRVVFKNTFFCLFVLLYLREGKFESLNE